MSCCKPAQPHFFNSLHCCCFIVTKTWLQQPLVRAARAVPETPATLGDLQFWSAPACMPACLHACLPACLSACVCLKQSTPSAAMVCRATLLVACAGSRLEMKLVPPSCPTRLACLCAALPPAIMINAWLTGAMRPLGAMRHCLEGDCCDLAAAGGSNGRL
jgi:hypothetical protein